MIRIQLSRSISISRSRKPELAHPVEVGDRLGRQRQAVAGRELGDPLAGAAGVRGSRRAAGGRSPSTAAANSSSSAASSSRTRDSGTPASAKVRILMSSTTAAAS